MDRSVFKEFAAKLLVVLLGMQSPAPIWAGELANPLSRQIYHMPHLSSSPNLATSLSAALASRTQLPSKELLQLRSSSAPLARLFKPKYLPLRPDDPADPYIAAQASALGNDPNQIFVFVRDQISFEAYYGSVRGARGTLWAKAGNMLDKASLLVALLGAAGFTATYQHANIAGSTSQINLLRGMFPQTSRFVGCLPAGSLTDDPAFNGNAQFGSNDYYWVQYGSSGTALDPNVPGAQPGQAFQTPDSSFTTIPQNLRQQVTIKINAELYSQAAALYGLGPNTVTVLSQTFDTSALVGNVITAGNFFTASAGGALDFTATTFTYTPYLLVGSGGPDVSQDNVITGTDYQEFYTNFSLSSQVLTGLFLEIDADDINYQQHPYTHTILDRLGPAARQGNASVSLSLPPTPAPALTDFDLTTININSARQPASSIQAQQARLSNAYNNYLAIKPLLNSIPTSGTLSASQQAIVQQGATLGKYLTIAENELLSMGYNASADVLTSQLQTGYYARVYPNSPRLTVAETSYNNGNSFSQLDILKNDMLVIDGLGQNRSTSYYEEVARGVLESLMESSVLTQITGQTATGIGEVLGALGDPNLLTALGPGTFTTPPDPNALAGMTLSPDAQTLILNAVANGKVVITPTQMVTVNGATTVGWWETDQNGHTISHFDNGGHQAIASYAATLEFSQKFNKPIVQFIGRVEGFAVVGIAYAAAILNVVADPVKTAKTLNTGSQANNISKFLGQFNKIIGKLKSPLLKAAQTGFGLIGTYADSLVKGIDQAAKWVTANLPFDPDSLEFISTPLGPPQPAPNPGNTPGVQVANVTTDPLFTMPFNGNELPLVFDLPITNTGPATDSFNININSSSQYFRVYPTISLLTLQGGQSGMVNVCVVPFDTTGTSLPSVGQPQNYSVTVTSASNPSITASTQSSFNAPALPSIEVSLDPAAVAVTPGGNTPINLNLSSVGNISAGPVTLAAAPPTGISITGLTSPVTVPMNGVTTESLSFGAAANLGNGTYNVDFTATYTPAGGTTQQVPFTVPVTVQALGTCVVNAASAATQVGKTTLAADLNALSTDMSQAAAAPSNAALTSRVVGDMRLLISQELSVPFLQALAPSLTAATNAVAAATPATLPAALSSLNSAICSLATALSQANAYNAFLRLSPSNSQVTGPNQPVTFTLLMQNLSPNLVVYNLSTTGVPAGVTVQFSQPTATLGPSGSQSSFLNSITLTLTPGATFNTPFAFNVVATPQGAPDFAVAAPGSLTVRPESVNVDQITVTPPLPSPGTPITVSARVFSVVNQVVPNAVLQLVIEDSTGKPVTFPFNSNPFTLTTTSGLQTVTFNPIDTTNLKAGSYILSVQPFAGGGSLSAPAAGPLVLGAPLTAALTANPSTVVPGSATVQAALTINRDSIPNPISTLIGTVQVNGVPRSMALYKNGNQQLAYVCSDSQVNIIDVTNPASPTILSTFANGLLTENGGTSGFSTVNCGIYNSDLILSYSRENGNTSASPTAVPTNFAVFSLANPLNPTQVGTPTSIVRPDSGGLYVLGNSALLGQNDVLYNPFSNFIFQQNGDVWTLDLTNAATNGTLSFLSDLYPCGGINSSTNACNNGLTIGGTFVPNDQYRGGPFAVHSGTEVNSTTAYFASSNSTGGNILEPGNPPFNGQLLVVDDSNPASLSITTKIDVPQSAFLTGVAVQGNIALAVGDSTGIYDINSGYTGTLVLASFDITNPKIPVLLNTVVTALTDKGGPTVVPLGNNTFAVGGTSNNGKGSLVLVDASNPSALRYLPYDALFVASPQVAQAPYFYTLSATPFATTNQLSIFQLSTINGPQISVSLQIPNNSHVALVPNSFNQTPSSSTPGSGFTTYVWNQPSTNTITFNLNLTGVNPGDVTNLVNTGELDFTLPTLGSGKIDLGALSVLTQQIMSISPERQAVVFGGDTANYTVTISNPTNVTQTFTPSVIVPAGWTAVTPPTVTVPAGSSQNFNVAVTPPLNTQVTFNSFTFTVAANSATGISASVLGQIDIGNTGANLGGNGQTRFLTFVAGVTPSQITIGQGNFLSEVSQPFAISITNTGNFADVVSVNSPQGLPPGWSWNFTPSFQAIPQPGTTSVITGTIIAGYTVAPGQYPITIPVSYSSQVQNLNLMLNVSGSGVTGIINPNPGTPSSNFVLTLFNTGQAQDTYNLSVLGSLAQAASVPSSVTIPAAGQQNIPITLSPVGFVAQSSVQLQVRAVSKNDPTVQRVITATVNVPSAKGVTSAIVPSSASVNTSPQTVNLLFDATNTGNGTDSYSAQITGTTGPVTASLVDSNGQSGSSIAQFSVTALGTAQFPLNATINGSGKSTVTVTVTSLSMPSVTSSSTVTINGPSSQLPPVSNAGTGGNVPLHRIAILNGSASSDPNSPALPLSYAWTLLSAPSGSMVSTASIRFANSPEAVFVPDVLGAYTFNLAVTTSAGSSNSTVTDNAQIFPPVAVAGKSQNAATGNFVFLNGKDSYDPNGLPLTFAWTFSSVPGGSMLTSANLLNANTPKPFFTPDVAGVYSLQLIVNNGALQSAPNTVQITVGTGSLPPNSRAGADQNSLVSQTVSLDGSGSNDPNSPALPLAYLWTFLAVPSGSALTNAQLANANMAQAQFAPDVAGDFVLNLHVSNSAGASDDTVTVHAFAGQSNSFLSDVPPNAVSGPDQYAVPANPVNLDGSKSNDPDNGPAPLTYNWWFNALPTASAAVLANPATAAPGFTPDLTGYYIARQEGSDGFASGFKNTLITVAQKCDADANGVFNSIDLQLIQAALGQTAGIHDPRDPLAAGTITAGDLSYCQGVVNPSLPNAGSTPASLTFTGPVGTTPSSQTLTVTSSGAAFNFTLSTDQTWLSATPGSGNTSSNTITVSVITTGLTAQTYQGNVIISSSGAGNTPFKIPVTLTLETASITASSGTPQIANVNSPFAVAFQAAVKDPGNNPVPGVTVTFTAPANGPSGTFPGNLSAATAVTNALGVATAPVFTANGNPGNYSVSATVAAATTPAIFVLTNAVPGPTSLGGAIAGKSGPANARVWTFQVGNNGPGSALGAQINSITLQQTNGAACTPIITSPTSFPLSVGNIGPQATANVNITINFTGCAANAAFKVTVTESANNGAATGTVVRLNQFQ